MARRTQGPVRLGVSDPPKIYTLDVSRLDGGLNTWELDYRIAANQSPDMVNMYWVDGALGSRPGQEYLTSAEEELGTGYALYEKLWSGYIIAHIGEKLYSIDPDTGSYVMRYSGLTGRKGKFFVFGSDLYYMNGAEYIKIETDLAVSAVSGYVPVTVVNLKPDGTGGSMYQPENRISAGKEVWFNPDGTSKEYHLPYKELDSTAITVEVWGSPKTENTDFTVDRETGIVTFTEAPESRDAVNGVKIKCYKENPDAMNSIMQCTQVTVYGSGNDMAVVFAGPPAQPNAFFWSGSHSVLDPTYFPMDYYNLAGSADEYITGFGKQQNMLVIFKSRSVGKAYFSTETINSRDYLRLSYQPINDKIGCDLPDTIQLVSNNLVFANTLGGVYMITDTTSAGENTIVRLSRNINGTDARKGLLDAVRNVSASAVVSFDDGQRYWICVNDDCYLWDYLISPYLGDETKLSWFYFNNIDPVSWIKTADDVMYLNDFGRIVRFTPGSYADFGESMYRKYRFATHFFNTYEVLKDVIKVILVVRSDTNSTMELTYETDYESRKDLTPIRAYSYQLSPRNLSYRALSVVKYAQACIRRPGCFHIRHFTMTLENNVAYTDMSVVGAQIFYKYAGGDR